MYIREKLVHATSKRGAVTKNTISLFTDWILLFHQWQDMSSIYWFLLCLCIERDDFTSDDRKMGIARDVNIFFYICDSSKRYYVMNRWLSRRLRRMSNSFNIHTVATHWSILWNQLENRYRQIEITRTVCMFYAISILWLTLGGTVQCIHKSFCIDSGTFLCGAIFRLKTINSRFTWIRLHSNNAFLANGFDGMKWIC